MVINLINNIFGMRIMVNMLKKFKHENYLLK